MSEPIYTIGPQDLAVGFAPDLPKQAPPVLDTGENAMFTDLSVQPIAGQFTLITADSVGEPLMGLKATIIGGQRYAFIATPTRLLRWDGANLTDVSKAGGYSGTAHDFWSIERWGNWVVATNGIDPVQVYKGVSFADLSGVTFATAKHVITAPGQPFLLAFETAGGAEGGFGFMHWCERDDIETWTAALTNFAGFLPIRNIVSPVVAVLALGGVIPFFTSDAMYVANFVGHPFSFGATKVADGIGATGKFSVTAAGGRLYGLSSRGAWTSDLGGNYRYFDIPLVREHLLTTLAFSQPPHHPVTWHDRAEHSIVFFYPSGTEHGNSRGVAYNYLDDNWTILSFGRNVVDDHGVFDYALAGDHLGNLFYQAAPGQIGTETPLPGTGVPGVFNISEDLLQFASFGIGAFGAFEFGDP